MTMLRNCSTGDADTGLEESMWRLRLGGETYLVRPGASDCAYYMLTGVYGFVNRCSYNHPRDCATVEAIRRLYPERIGEPPCQVPRKKKFYLKTGTCQFGESCKFHHPKNAAGSMSHIPLNIYGYPELGGTIVPPPPAFPPQFYPSVQPLMPDQYGGPSSSLRTLLPGSEPPCRVPRKKKFYLKTGTCQFRESCKFHHPKNAAGSMSHIPLNIYGYPELGGTIVPPPPAFPPQIYPLVQPLMPDQYGVPSSSLRTLLPGSSMQGAYGPMLLTPKVVPGWSPYSHAVGATSLYGAIQLSNNSPLLPVVCFFIRCPFLQMNSLLGAIAATSSSTEHI